jgi:hypothetical protein
VRILQTILSFLFLSAVVAQHATYTQVFSQEDLRSINAQSLQDVVQMSPWITSYLDGLEMKNNAGNIPQQSIAIYRNNLPLFADQNFTYSLATIPVYNLDSIKICLGDQNVYGKNNAGLSIYLYTSSFEKEPFNTRLQTSFTALSDVHSNLLVNRNTSEHKLLFAGGYSFTNGDRIAPSRAFVAPLRQRTDVSLNYSYLPINGIRLNLFSHNHYLSSTQRTEVITGTTRALDFHTNQSHNTAGGDFSLKLSKRHTAKVYGLYNRQQFSQSAIQRDLYTGKHQREAITPNLDSLAYRQLYMRAELQADHNFWGYQLGIDLSNTNDRQFTTIDAIPTSYTDFSLFANLSYQQANKFDVQGGVKLLTLSLTNPILLPHFQGQFYPHKMVEFNVAITNAAQYADIHQIYYPQRITLEAQNNISLPPARLRSYNANVRLKTEHIKVTSGLALFEQTELPIVINNRYQNGFSRTTGLVYLDALWTNEVFTLQPIASITRISSSTDSLQRFYFMPRIFVRGALHLKPIKTEIHITAKLMEQNTEVFRYRYHQIGPYNLIDFSLTTKVIPKVDITLGAKNILDNVYTSFNTFNNADLSGNLRVEDWATISRNRILFVNLSYSVH